MLFGGHVKSIDDIAYLRNLRFDLGEVVLANAATLQYWRDSGVLNNFGPGFFLIAHGPQEGPPNDVRHLWDQYYPALLETVDRAHDMGIGFLTIHLWMDQRFVRLEPIAEKKRLLRDLMNYAAPMNITISLENLSESTLDLALIIDAVPDLAITLDVGHGQLLTETNTSFAIIRELMPAIKHVHLHDNRGGTSVRDDLHLPIGEGIVDFHGILRALLNGGYQGTATLELENEQLAGSMKTLKNILFTVERYSQAL
jgi:sugar phosphate isomerase/epimerase